MLGKQFCDKNRFLARRSKNDERNKFSPGSAATDESKNSNYQYTKLSLKGSSQKQDKVQLPTTTAQASAKNNRQSRSPLLEVQANNSTFVASCIDADSQLDFKMMDKPHPGVYTQEDFKLIEDAFNNLESIIPQKQQRSRSNDKQRLATQKGLGANLVTQKQLIESLERVTLLSKVHSSQQFEDQNHIYRLLLKVHSQLLKIKSPLSVSQQIDLMVKFLNIESSKIETKVMAEQNYLRCLIQKTFLAFLDNMAAKLNLASARTDSHNPEADVTFRQSSQNSAAKSKSKTNQPRSILKSSSGIKKRHNGSSIVSPQRKLDLNQPIIIDLTVEAPEHKSSKQQNSTPSRKSNRKQDKENSPVRNFLDAGEQKSQIINIQEVPVRSIEHPSLVLQSSSIFDHKLSNDSFGSIPSGMMATQDNFLLLLKCLRIWKQFTKYNQQLRYEAKEEERFARQARNTSINDLSLEISKGQDLERAAEVHYRNCLANKVISSLIIYVVELQKDMKQLREHFDTLHCFNLRANCFKQWRNQARNKKIVESQVDLYEYKLIHKSFQHLNYIRIAKKKIHAKFIKQCKWKIMRKVFYKFLERAIQRRYQINKVDEFVRIKLKTKSIQGYRKYLQTRMEKALKFIECRSIYRQALIFVSWSNLMNSNRCIREQFFAVKRLDNEYRLAHFFNEWKDETKEIKFAKSIRNVSLMKTVVSSLTKFIERRERKSMVLKACCQHMNKARLRSIMSLWRKQVNNQQNFRDFQLKMYDHMDRFKMRQVYKSWFNCIDILKKTRFLNDHTEAWYDRRQRRKIFKAWKREIKMKKAFFIVLDNHEVLEKQRWIRRMLFATSIQRKEKELKEKTENKITSTLFTEWLNLLSRTYVMRKGKFLRRLNNRLRIRSFAALKKYTKQKIRFREGMKSLLKLRANNIMRKAFVNGLKLDWHSKVIERNLEIASRLSARMRLLKKPFKALRSRMYAKKHGIMLTKQHLYMKKKYYFNIIQKRYLLDDDGSRYFQRLQTQLKRNIFGTLFNHWTFKKSLRTRLSEFEPKHIHFLQLKSLKFIESYKNLRKYKKDQQKKYTMLLHKPALLRNVIRRLQINTQRSKIQKSELQNFTKNITIRKLGIFVSALKHQIEVIRKQRFLGIQHRHQVMRDCLQSLQVYTGMQIKWKLFNQKVNDSTKAKVLDGLFRYMNYRKYFSNKQRELTHISERNLKKKYVNQLLYWKCQSMFDKHVTRKIHVSRMKSHLKAWHELCQEINSERTERATAQNLFMKHWFGRLRIGAHLYKKIESKKGSLTMKQRQFFEFNSKRRALSMMFKHRQERQLSHLQRQWTRKTCIKRVFYAWYNSLDQLKRKRILRETAQVMSNNQNMEKCFNALMTYAAIRQRNKNIIAQFQERSELTLKAEMMVALHENIAYRKYQRQQFYSKLEFLGSKWTSEPFQRWLSFIDLSRLEQKADEFYLKRKAQYILRLSFDSIKISNLKRRQKTIQNDAINGWYNKLLLQRSLVALKYSTYEQKRINNVQKIIGFTNESQVKYSILKALKKYVVQRRSKNVVINKAVQFYKQNIYRKCLIELSMTNYKSQVVKNIQKQHILRILNNVVQEWKNKVIVARKFKKVFSILQNQLDSRCIHRFMPAMIKLSFFDSVANHIINKRELSMKQEFFNEVQKRILQRKILFSFIRSNEFEMKRRIFVQIKLNAIEQLRSRQIIDNHLQEVEEETKYDMVQIFFNFLKQRVVLKRFKNISQNCYKLKMMKKVFYALQKNDINEKLLRSASIEVQKMQEAKYLYFWRQLYLKEQENKHAAEYMETNQQYHIFKFWRNYTQQRMRAKNFHKNVIQRNMKSFCIMAMQDKMVYDRRVSQAAKKVKEKNDVLTQHRMMREWIYAAQESKIEGQMTKYANLKQLKELFLAWKSIKDYKNERRINLFRIREQLEARPELARPLLVMKNSLLAKAFNKLRHGAPEVYSEDMKEKIASEHYNYQLQRKCYLCLTLNNQLEVQEKQADEISQLFLKRRWLNYMKMGTEYLKERRRERHRASIFRFLSLQKKAFSALLDRSVRIQEARIKRDYAMQLYYNRLLDLAMSSLRVYKTYKRNQRVERINRKNNTTQKDRLQESVSRSVSADIRKEMQSYRQQHENESSLNQSRKSARQQQQNLVQILLTNQRVSTEGSVAEFAGNQDSSFEHKLSRNNNVIHETSQFKQLSKGSNIMTGEAQIRGTFASSDINPNVYSYGENRNYHKANQNESDEEAIQENYDDEILTLNQHRTSINWGVGQLETAVNIQTSPQSNMYQMTNSNMSPPAGNLMTLGRDSNQTNQHIYIQTNRSNINNRGGIN